MHEEVFKLRYRHPGARTLPAGRQRPPGGKCSRVFDVTCTEGSSRKGSGRDSRSILLGGRGCGA